MSRITRIERKVAAGRFEKTAVVSPAEMFQVVWMADAEDREGGLFSELVDDMTFMEREFDASVEGLKRMGFGIWEKSALTRVKGRWALRATGRIPNISREEALQELEGRGYDVKEVRGGTRWV